MEKRKEELKKGLKSRYMSMIAIGGTIGAGLFFTSGSGDERKLCPERRSRCVRQVQPHPGGSP